MRRPEHFLLADPHWRNVSAIYIFQLAVMPQPGNDHGGVFRADVFFCKEAVERGNDLGEGHARDQMRVHHALENRRQQSR